MVAELTISLVLKFIVVVLLVPLFSVPALVSVSSRFSRDLLIVHQLIGGLGGILGELYIHGQLSVKVSALSEMEKPDFMMSAEGDVERKEPGVLALICCSQWNRFHPSLWSSRVSSTW